ncbi:reverse transcriptase [Sesbania bispinosa]|nr:reverse transcriptase [Sesbania bispinosa]
MKSIILKAWGDLQDVQATDMGTNMFMLSFKDKKQVADIVRKGPCPVVEGRLLHTFIQVRALLNIKKPMPTGCWIPRKELPKVWVFFKFERLQGLCLVIGHEQRTCKADRMISHVDQSLPRYGPSLGVPPAKEISVLIQEQQTWHSRFSNYGNKDKPREGDTEGVQTQDNEEDVGSTILKALLSGYKISTGREATHSSDTHGHMEVTNSGKVVVIIGQMGTKKDTFGDSGVEDYGANTFLQRNSLPPGNPHDPTTSLFIPHKAPVHPFAPNQDEEQGIGPQHTPSPVVTLDFLTPPHMRYFGAKLSARDTMICRDHFQIQPKLLKDKKNKVQMKEENLGYFVEFPDDNQGEEGVSERSTSLKEGEEDQLIQGWNKELSLEGGHLDFENLNFEQHHISISGANYINKIRKTICNLGEESKDISEEKMLVVALKTEQLMAGVAGLTLPHPQR